MAEASRIDWQTIKARWNTEAEVFHLAVLPKGAAQLFLAICDRLQWRATYRVEGYDFADWDELQRIVDLGIAGLTDTMRLSDLLAHVDGVEALLRQIRDRPCCGSGATDTIPNPTEGGGGIVPVGVEDVPDFTDDTDIVTSPPQTSFTDADEDAETTGPEMVEYLCAAAHWYYDLLHRWLSFMKLYSTLGGLVWEPVSAIINLVVSRYGGSNPIATMAVEVADQLVNLWPEVNSAIVDAIIDELEANRDDIICAIAVERDLAGMISAVYSQLQTITTALGYLNMLPMVSYPVFALALVSQGLIDLSDVEGSCEGCESPPEETNGLYLKHSDPTHNNPNGGEVPVDWQYNEGPYLLTNTVYEISDYYGASGSYNFWGQFWKDNFPEEDAIYTPGQFAIRSVGATWGDLGISWRNSSQGVTGTVANPVDGEWYTAPEGTAGWLAQPNQTGTPTIEFKLLQE